METKAMITRTDLIDALMSLYALPVRFKPLLEGKSNKYLAEQYLLNTGLPLRILTSDIFLVESEK